MAAVPEIRIGFLRFVGQEALRAHRWPIMFLVVARARLTLSLAAVLLVGAFKPEQLIILRNLSLLP
jgi:hypothetical protein